MLLSGNTLAVSGVLVYHLGAIVDARHTVPWRNINECNFAAAINNRSLTGV